MNLAAGNGYVGLMGGPQLVDPPFYPMLIRTSLFFTHSPVASARAVSIAAGTLLVPLVFLIVLSAYGRRPAWIAALICGLHPFLIGFSGFDPCRLSVHYLACWHRLLRPRESAAASDSLFIALGSLLGLAYLTKAEMIAEIAALPVLISVVGAWKHRLKYALSGAALVLACSAALCQPLRSISIPTRASFAA